MCKTSNLVRPPSSNGGLTWEQVRSKSTSQSLKNNPSKIVGFTRHDCPFWQVKGFEFKSEGCVVWKIHPHFCVCWVAFVFILVGLSHTFYM
jgi:hypothetical protein